MITSELVSMLWCPTCQAGGLQPSPAEIGEAGLEEGELRCEGCDATYPVELGVPVLIPEAARSGSDWKLWRDHLEKFQARRQERSDNPDRAVTRLARKSQPQPSFAEFTGIEEGTLLDVGCGPGKFRFYFDRGRVRYFGLDPIVLPEVADFPFVQGLAEYIPFAEDTFTDVVALAALDHFRRLDRFLVEARRVLRTGGRLHLLQSVHEIRGPVSAVKVVAHKVKDGLEERIASGEDRDVPKHMAEFTNESLLEKVSGTFDVVSTARYSGTWYSPVKVFLSLTPKKAP